MCVCFIYRNSQKKSDPENYRPSTKKADPQKRQTPYADPQIKRKERYFKYLS
jgi:hypothetical protein